MGADTTWLLGPMWWCSWVAMRTGGGNAVIIVVWLCGDAMVAASAFGLGHGGFAAMFGFKLCFCFYVSFYVGLEVQPWMIGLQQFAQ